MDTDSLTPLGRFADPALLILSSLAGGMKHGYAITQDVEASTGKKLGPGTLYAALGRLESRGLIEAAAPESRRRPYRLTDAGRSSLRGQLSALREFSDAGLQRLGEA